MHNRDIGSQIQRLNGLIKNVSRACGEDTELLAQWAKHICVLSAGLIENSVKAIYIDFAAKSVSKPIANFVAGHLSQIRNPKAQKFIQTATSFRKEWGDDLQKFMDENGRGDAIDSIMAHRHLIAHGKENNSTISFIQAKTYLEKSIEVIEFAEKLSLK